MSYPWTLLGISQTQDIKVIKSAYAKLLRKTKPDEDPEGFSELNDAYNTAISLAKGSKATPLVSYQAELKRSEIKEEDMDTLWKESFEQKQEPEPKQERSEQFKLIINPLPQATPVAENTSDTQNILKQIYHLVDTKNYDPKLWKTALEDPNLVFNQGLLKHLSYYTFSAILDEVRTDPNKNNPGSTGGSALNVLVLDPFYAVQKKFFDKNIDLLMFLENMFAWSSDWKKLEQMFGSETHIITDEIERTKTNSRGFMDRWAEKQIAAGQPGYDTSLAILDYLAEKFNAPKNSPKYRMLETALGVIILLLVAGFIGFMVSLDNLL